MCQVCDGVNIKTRPLPIMKIYSGNVTTKELFSMMQMEWGVPKGWQESNILVRKIKMNQCQQCWVDTKQISDRTTFPMLMRKT